MTARDSIGDTVRARIRAARAEGLSQSAIAAAVGVGQSTVCRELSPAARAAEHARKQRERRATARVRPDRGPTATERAAALKRAKADARAAQDARRRALAAEIGSPLIARRHPHASRWSSPGVFG